jgi:hypothetical protein
MLTEELNIGFVAKEILQTRRFFVGTVVVHNMLLEFNLLGHRDQFQQMRLLIIQDM